MAVTDAPFRSINQLIGNAKSSKFSKYTFTKRDDGFFYYTSYELHPDAVAIIEEMQAKGGNVLATGAAITKPARTPPARKDGAIPVTQQIRDWVIFRPQATKADAMAAFPTVNPSTVGVQFGKARKGC